LDDSERAPCGASLIDGDIGVEPLKSFVTATVVAIAEMAGTEVVVREVYQKRLDSPCGDISARVRITSVAEGMFVLGFPQRTAAAIAERVLANVREEINGTLVCDCVGEIANVIAGQAKTLLAGTRHQMTFSLPQVTVGNAPSSQPEHGRNCVLIKFCSDLGEFTIRLVLEQ
jgi:chemotaxis protein CheX